VKIGTQTSEIRVEQRAASGLPANDVNYMILWPTERASNKARGVANNEPTKLLAYDAFEQTAGNLEGKSLPFPAATTWAEINKTGEDGFLVNSTSHLAERAKVSDTNLNSGCFLTAGTATYAAVQVNGSCIASTSALEQLRLGLLARYVSTESWLAAAFIHDAGDATKGEIAGSAGVYLVVLKRVAGVLKTLGYSYVG